MLSAFLPCLYQAEAVVKSPRPRPSGFERALSLIDKFGAVAKALIYHSTMDIFARNPR